MSMESNNPVKFAADFINQSNRNLFLTGRAGTGKTTFLKELRLSTYKKTVVVAPTGIAAINAGGVTIHSFFQLPFGNFIPRPFQNFEAHGFKVNDPVSLIKELQIRDRKRTLIRQLELLIIDEVSMLRADIIDAMDVVLRHIRKKTNIPFGGVQVLFIGDMHQLPPVVKENEWRLLKNYYDSMYFFDSHVLKNNPPIYIELEKIYRQHDPVFISMLNNVRDGEITQRDVELLNQHYIPGYEAKSDDHTITITTHNRKADEINQRFLSKLKGKEFYFMAEVYDEFPEHQYPIEERLILKVGVQVMFIKNDPSGQGLFYNGRIGIVKDLSDEQIEVEVEGQDESIIVEKYVWENIRFELNEQKQEIEEIIIGKYVHYPLKLAWAITVHKSQGLTFEKAILDISDSFATGQIYVALSRLTGLKGLVLKSRINFDNLVVDKKVVDFSETKTPTDNLLPILEEERFNFVTQLILEKFLFFHLYQDIKRHTDMFADAEEGLFKDDYIEFSRGLFISIKEMMEVSEKFDKQIRNLSWTKTKQSFERIMERCLAADKFFSTKLMYLSELCIGQLKRCAEDDDESFSYMEDLMGLEKMIFEQLKGIQTCAYICRCIIDQSQIDLKNIYNTDFDKDREINIASLKMITFKEIKRLMAKKKKSKKKSEAKPKEPKPPKVPTKDISYQYFTEGNTIEEIATIRGLSPITILGHLIPFISEGKIDPLMFLSAEKLSIITELASKMEVTNLTSLKEVLGDNYSFNEIRIALATLPSSGE